MATFSLWLASPRVEEHEVQREIEILCKSDRDDLRKDIFGWDCDACDPEIGPAPMLTAEGPHHDSPVCSSHRFFQSTSNVDELDEFIRNIEVCSGKKALEEAERRCPEETEKSKVLFLRCCRAGWSPEVDLFAVAEKLCQYWERRKNPRRTWTSSTSS